MLARQGCLFAIGGCRWRRRRLSSPQSSTSSPTVRIAAVRCPCRPRPSAFGLDDIGAFANCCLAQVYTIAGRLRDAVEVGELALAVFEARGNLWWAGRTLGHLTWAANALGEWEASLSYCRRALEHGIALQDVRLKTIGWWRMASASVQQGDLKLGFECCNEALALAAIPYDIAMARAIRGYALIRAGQVDAGMAELRECAEWFESAHLRR